MRGTRESGRRFGRAARAAVVLAPVVLTLAGCAGRATNAPQAAPAPRGARPAAPKARILRKPAGTSGVAEILAALRDDPESLRGKTVVLWACEADGVCGMFGLVDPSSFLARYINGGISRINAFRPDDDQVPFLSSEPYLITTASSRMTIAGVRPSPDYPEAPVVGLFAGHFYGTPDETQCVSSPDMRRRVFVVDRMDWTTAPDARTD